MSLYNVDPCFFNYLYIKNTLCRATLYIDITETKDALNKTYIL